MSLSTRKKKKSKLKWKKWLVGLWLKIFLGISQPAIIFAYIKN
jgi:cytoskeletal protein RodZ